MKTPSLLSKYKGSVYAALAGDCFGAIYEPNWSPVPFNVLITLDQKLKSAGENLKEYIYTDDTEMAHVLANSLIDDQGFDPQKVVIRFAETYVKTLSYARWYGANVTEVFHKVKMPQYANDPYRAASEQFHGQGSYGNGSGMRVFPVALYYHNNCENIEMVAGLSAKLTHTHRDAVNGAILQAMAVEFALSSDLSVTWEKFYKFLKVVIDKLEADNDDDDKPYTEKFDAISSLLKMKSPVTHVQVGVKIGVGIKATEAISAAVFAFLYCLAERQPSEVKRYNKVEQSIFYAISLGGDTDTIATMTGAIAGAFWGHEMVPDYWLKHFEGKNIIEDLAVKLYDVNSKRQNDVQR